MVTITCIYMLFEGRMSSCSQDKQLEEEQETLFLVIMFFQTTKHFWVMSRYEYLIIIPRNTQKKICMSSLQTITV